MIGGGLMGSVSRGKFEGGSRANGLLDLRVVMVVPVQFQAHSGSMLQFVGSNGSRLQDLRGEIARICGG